ncbi:MAG: DUF4038 domain-containing protein [Lachnospiraceae bacterium]|nr:DUF4038 domain-containing protein [Lachnospiraceae bacterium]
MSRIIVNSEKNGFEKDGKPFFYLADTFWSAFTNATEDEWIYYLEKRKMQGFNTVQINTMPQWDRCLSDIGIYPFETEDGQKFDFTKRNDEYYKHAAKMCEIAVEKGFTPALVVLWLNFVPDTWAAKFMDCNLMSEDFIRPYTENIVEVFDRFDPIYIVSGDTDFETPRAIRYYKQALDVLCEKSPDSLKTLHIKRGYDVIPEELIDKIDFYMYQSGHNKDGQDMAYKLPASLKDKYPKKPIVNAEPCYEQMGYSRNVYGRFGQEDVRKAAWQSILSGASAGVTYGAHGVWNWYKSNAPHNKIIGEGFDCAFPCMDALHFPGASDYGFIKKYILNENLCGIQPVQEILLNETEEIRIAKKNDTYLAYVPRTTCLRLKGDFSACIAIAYDLTTHAEMELKIQHKENESTFEMPLFQRDMVISISK